MNLPVGLPQADSSSSPVNARHHSLGHTHIVTTSGETHHHHRLLHSWQAVDLQWGHILPELIIIHSQHGNVTLQGQEHQNQIESRTAVKAAEDPNYQNGWQN
jgi:hypothetical protein